MCFSLIQSWTLVITGLITLAPSVTGGENRSKPDIVDVCVGQYSVRVDDEHRIAVLPYCSISDEPDPIPFQSSRSSVGPLKSHVVVFSSNRTSRGSRQIAPERKERLNWVHATLQFWLETVLPSSGW